VTDTVSSILLGLAAVLTAYTLWKEIADRRKLAQ
jgi:hypothetical protein